MATKSAGSNQPEKEFHLEGAVQLQGFDSEQDDLSVKAFAFDKLGEAVGESDVDANGNFKIAVHLEKPADVQLMIGPGTDARSVRQSSAYLKSFAAKDWAREGAGFLIRPKVTIPKSVWWPWRPVRICVSGHVRKLHNENGHTGICPVPFVKVEIFDVDREGCWWPYIRKWWEVLLDRPVIRIPELLRKPPIPPRPWPGPDPAPYLRFEQPARSAFTQPSPDGPAGLNPQPLPPHGEAVGLNPQPLPPHALARSESAAYGAAGRVGEARLMDPAIASRLDRLTLTSRIPPWLIFPLCFYSKEEVCETYTDCNGYFRCCFKWWPIHFRNGRLKFDSRPDIIIRVTQIINGIPTVIYLDPYTSTRWNVTNAHIDLFLDNEDVICGSGHCYQPPAGSPVFFTRIGNDEVYQINQTNGLYNDAGTTNVAYGSTLHVYGQFGDNLTRSDPGHGDPPPYYYYRLSYAKQGSSDADYKFVDVDLNDTRVSKTSLIGTSHKLGPYTVGAAHSLYEVRNFSDYYWYNPDWIGIWRSKLVEENTGTYVLRLELYDKNGNKLNTASGTVDYRNGAGIGNGTPPAPLPVMVDHCDLVITLDNQGPVPNLTIPAVINECGVIPWSPALVLNFNVAVTQPNGRLNSWTLQYTKGVNPAVTVLASDSSSSGTLSPVNTPVSGAPLLAGLASTCAFALKLYAWAHIRNGYGLVYYEEDIKAIAIEKCGPCPECD